MVTAQQCQLACLFESCISFSTVILIALVETLSASSLTTLDVSTVQYSMSVMVDGVVPIDDMERILAGVLFSSVHATSAYDGLGLLPTEVLRATLPEMASS